MTTITYENVVACLIERIPEFDGIYREHLGLYKETLPHVLFGELVRFTKAVCGSSSEPKGQYANPQNILKRILDFIEEAACSEDERVVELVQVSFMENLHQLGPYYQTITLRLGPKSQTLLQASQW